MLDKQMRNLLICFFIGVSCLIVLSNSQKMVTLAKVPKTSEAESKLVNEKAEDAIKHYKEFVNQTDMYAYTATKAYPRGDRMAKYGFGDSNGDGVPELHISGGEKYDIYTYKKGKVVLLCELGWRYAMITAAKDGAMAACGRLDTEADSIEGSANYRIPLEDDIFADVGRIDGSTDYYYYFKIDKKGEIIDKESIYFCKIFHEKKGSKKYTYYAGGKKCNKADWEKKVKLCRGILKDETKQLKWNDIFPKEEWDYLDAMEEGNGTLEKESDSEEWKFYKRILSGDFSSLKSGDVSSLRIDERASITYDYEDSLDKSSGRSEWKYILLDFNGDGVKDLFIQFNPRSENYTSANFNYGNVSTGVAFFSYKDGKIDWWKHDGTTGIRFIPLRNGRIIHMESFPLTKILSFSETTYKCEKKEKYTILNVDLEQEDSYYNLDWYKENYGEDRGYKNGDTLYFVEKYKDNLPYDEELSKEEWEEIEKRIEEQLIPDNEWKPVSVFLPNRYSTRFTVG